MTWDTTDTVAVLGGDASGSASTTVTYSGKTLIVDVTTNFTVGQVLEISALQPGERVDARGHYARGEFVARSLALAGGAPSSRRVKLEGTIDAVDTEADAFRLLGVGVRVTPETWVELD